MTASERERGRGETVTATSTNYARKDWKYTAMLLGMSEEEYIGAMRSLMLHSARAVVAALEGEGA